MNFTHLVGNTPMIRIRYSLVPYLYSEFLKAALQDEMMFRPLAFDFADDADAKQVDDQLLLGNELMIAPIYKQNAKGRYVYLPEEMMLVRICQNAFRRRLRDRDPAEGSPLCSGRAERTGILYPESKGDSFCKGGKEHRRNRLEHSPSPGLFRMQL